MLPAVRTTVGKPGPLHHLFRPAGYASVATTKLAAHFKLFSVRDYLRFFRTSAGLILQTLARLDDKARNLVWQDLREVERIHYAGPTGRSKRASVGYRATANQATKPIAGRSHTAARGVKSAMRLG